MTSSLPRHTLTHINSLTEHEFIQLFGSVYEHSPWAASQAYQRAPFNSIPQLLASFQDEVDNASQSRQLALLQAHPELGEQKLDSLTRESRNEQQGAGLTQADDEMKAQLKSLNHQYREKHGFPFIIAVAGLTPEDILSAMDSRVSNPTDLEFHTALGQVHRIAEIRVHQIVQ